MTTCLVWFPAKKEAWNEGNYKIIVRYVCMAKPGQFHIKCNYACYDPFLRENTMDTAVVLSDLTLHHLGCRSRTRCIEAFSVGYNFPWKLLTSILLETLKSYAHKLLHQIFKLSSQIYAFSMLTASIKHLIYGLLW